MRQLDLGRDKAEWLVDLLEDCDPSKEGSWRFTMARDIRDLFGMISMETERENKRAAQAAIRESNLKMVRQMFGMRDDETTIPREKYEEFRNWLKQFAEYQRNE